MGHERETTDGVLAQECRIFTMYLAGRKPSTYVGEKYVSGQASLPGGRPDRFDALLMTLARRGRLGVALGDTYAQFFRPTSVLRQKLVLQLAILENSPEFHTHFNSADDAGWLSVVGRLGLRSGAFFVMLLVAILLLGPPHLLLRGRTPASPPRVLDG